MTEETVKKGFLINRKKGQDDCKTATEFFLSQSALGAIASDTFLKGSEIPREMVSLQYTKEVLEDNFEQGKALPELLFKRYLIEWYHDMVNAQGDCLFDLRNSGGFVNPLKLFRLEACISRMFLPISAMIVNNKIFVMPDFDGGSFWRIISVKSDY